MKTIDKNKAIFLLGGLDLEMQTIKNILEENCFDYMDACLRWNNANLSAYIERLEDNKMYYGVELVEDCRLPNNYVRIDHHNDCSDRRSSLEQVASLLDIKLNRWQKLVAINDARYIDGLKEYGATEEEIKSIRLADRSTQGVTEEEESEAEASIKKSKEVGDIRVVYTSVDHFSPITDRLYPYDKLIIFNDYELVYYGVGADMLVNQYKAEIEKHAAYFGGGSNGFFGLAKGCYTNMEIKENVKKIIDIVRK